MLTWLRETIADAAGAFVRFVPIFLIFVLARVVFLGSELPWTALIVIAVAAGAGVFAYATVPRNRRVHGVGFYFACATGGTVGMLALVIFGYLLFARGQTEDLGVSALLENPLFWGFWAIAGALTGYAYGRIAQMFRRPLPGESSESRDAPS
jgi:hypothetical protein